MTRLTLRLDFDDARRLGPGKVGLLEAIEATGSITGAARAMGMSYRRAWLLLEATNGMFRTPVVETAHGGTRGGGARVTAFGQEVVARYRAVEGALREAASADVAFLERHLGPAPE
jgi:molybdate transport system regulatory protein